MQYNWTVNNTTVPVPVGTWFKYEVFWHRSTQGSTNGRYWVAVNGQMIVDHSGIISHNRRHRIRSGKLPREVWIAGVSQMDLRTQTSQQMVSKLIRIVENVAVYQLDIIKEFELKTFMQDVNEAEIAQIKARKG